MSFFFCLDNGILFYINKKSVTPQTNKQNMYYVYPRQDLCQAMPDDLAVYGYLNNIE